MTAATTRSEREPDGGLTVRAAKPDELTEVGRITKDAYVADGHMPPDHSYGAKLLDAEGRYRDAELLVAVDAAERVLGTVTVCRHGGPYAELCQPGELEFRMLAVDPAARGRGAGHALVTAVLDRARAEGARRVVLCSLDRMRTAHRLYQRLGFHRAPDLDWHPDDRALLLAFALEL